MIQSEKKYFNINPPAVESINNLDGLFSLLLTGFATKDLSLIYLLRLISEEKEQAIIFIAYGSLIWILMPIII